MDPINFLKSGQKIKKYNGKTKKMYFAVDETLQYIYLFKVVKTQVKKKHMMKITNIYEIKKGYTCSDFNLLYLIFERPKKNLCFCINGINEEGENDAFMIACENKNSFDLLFNNLIYLFKYLYEINKHKILIKKND